MLKTDYYEIRVIDIISAFQKPFVIVSATANTTRELLVAAEEAIYNTANVHNMAETMGHRHNNLTNNFIKYYSPTTSNKKVNGD